MPKDTLFANPLSDIHQFVFDDAVADVFPDMIRRSVPGYETVLQILAVITQQYAQADSRIYDLGCSLGTATLSMYQAIQSQDLMAKFIAVDNSEAMLKRCESRLKRYIPERCFETVCDDIMNVDIDNSSVVASNFTVQFIPPEQRGSLFARVYQGLNKEGVFFLSEKIRFDNSAENDCQIDWYHAFKRANGYSELEINQKRAALDNVLISDTAAIHQQRLQEAGFASVYQVYQGFNFAAFVAIK